MLERTSLAIASTVLVAVFAVGSGLTIFRYEPIPSSDTAIRLWDRVGQRVCFVVSSPDWPNKLVCSAAEKARHIAKQEAVNSEALYRAAQADIAASAATDADARNGALEAASQQMRSEGLNGFQSIQRLKAEGFTANEIADWEAEVRELFTAGGVPEREVETYFAPKKP